MPQDMPFENDLLHREELGDNLKKFVLGCVGPLTISVNGAWGTGKTTFLRMWEQSLKNDGYVTIYFSAWEDDHCDNALLALLGQIWNNIKNSDWKEMGTTLKEIFVPFLTHFGGQLLTKVTGIKAENLKSHVEQMLDDYDKAISNLRATKERLAEVSQKCQEETGKPLVIIIDELDRCRPLFAIELLEKIKHFFELPGIIFVLGIDREQLGHSICSVYGNIDVDGYLRRFIDLEFLLQPNSVDAFVTCLFGKYAQNTQRSWTAEEIAWTTLVSKCFKLSLREIEFLIRTVVIGSFTNQNLRQDLLGDKLNFWFLLPLFVAIKLRDEAFYRKILSKQCNAVEITEQLVAGHHARKLFGYDSEIEDFTSYADGRHLCNLLYAISPQQWRETVRYALKDCADSNALPKEYFHAIAKQIFFPEGTTKEFLRGQQSIIFGQILNSRYSITDLLKCIEMVDFDVSTRRR